jgi:NAD(P)H-hydrate epimerase
MSAEIMTAGVGDGDHFAAADVDATLEAVARFDVVVLGPGLGREGGGFVTDLISRLEVPLVLDADGLNGLDGVSALAARPVPTIITPHGGEFARLTGEGANYGAASRLAETAGVVVLLKGNPTFVLGSERWVVTSGGPELATIGTGDVLAGAVAALWARGAEPEGAARSAAYWHGVAGAELAAAGTVTAERLAASIGSVAWIGSTTRLDPGHEGESDAPGRERQSPAQLRVLR